MTLLIIKGAGDIATGVAHRLKRSGYLLLMTELQRPTAIRRTVSFSQAVYDGVMEVEGVKAQKASRDNYLELIDSGIIPILTDADQAWLDSLNAAAFIEATLSKKNTGVTHQPGRISIALGPGYEAGKDVDAVVETARGHFLGRLILDGPASPNSGKPGLIGGYDLERLIKAPNAGEVFFDVKIGETVKAGQKIGRVGENPVLAAIDGVLRGALQNGLTVPHNFKIGDIDPRSEAASFIHSPSDKARAVAGAVLEGLLYFGVRP